MSGNRSTNTHGSRRSTMPAQHHVLHQSRRKDRDSAKQARRSTTIHPTHVITVVICSIISFYCGTIMGWNAASSQHHLGPDQNCNKICKQMVDDLKKNTYTSSEISQSTHMNKAIEGMSKRFSSKLSHWATGLVSINRKDLFDTFDFGVPMSPGAEHEDILLLYNDHTAMPTSRSLSREAEYNGDIPKTTAHEATENCDTMNVVFIKNPAMRSRVSQCVALVGGQYQGFHVQRWQRLIGEGPKGKTDRSAPLRLTSRMTNEGGYDGFLMPNKSHVKKHEAIMETYFSSLAKIRTELDGILKKIAKSNCVVVMTVNRGQSDLLINFVCSARARGFNLDNVIVFPTDTFSRELADSLGLATYYSHELMKHIPENDSKRYGDRTFGAIMLAKVICVHLVNDLGYDLLFQDVDVSWYKNPFDYFHAAENDGFDVYFQDDGNRQIRFAPFSANSGFYFARSNDRSKLLFRTMLYEGYMMFASRSHQETLIQHLSEHNSLSGLRVKVLNREDPQFPSGYHYHMKRDYMKQFVNENKTPYVFHMCWTLNKQDKIAFMKQMGMWYLKDQCIDKKAKDLGDINNDCCSTEPIVECFYSDKPSIKPCKESPEKDKGARSFW